MINKERMLSEFINLCKISSFSRNERLVADYLVPALKVLGFAVVEDATGSAIGGNCGNLIARKTGNLADAPTLMFSAHMDTVGPCEGVVPVIADDGYVYSSGDTVLGGDDKAGIVAIMEASRYLVEKNVPHGDLEIIFSVCEEQGITGAKHVDLSKLKFDYGYVLDAGGTPAHIITCAPAQDTFTVKIHGKAAHAGARPEDGVNAILAAANAISEMKLGRIDNETTANVGIIQGGTATNIIADLVEMKCEARSRNTVKLDAQVNRMLDTFKLEAEKLGAIVECDYHREYDSWQHDKNAAVMKLATAAAENAGLALSFREGGGGSDANIYNAAGRDTIVIGVGMSQVHATNERILVSDIYKAAEYVVSIIKTAAGGLKC
ncbi:MAG: M20/M25/M40 family metallo-hydrolase [Negativicutes bacterium]|jgi:tripeptide aminopeptidase